MWNTRRRTAALTVAAALVGGLVACSSGDGDGDDSEPRFGYALPRPIVTLNAASALGAATDAAKVSARLYPGAYLTGPDGRLLPNTDLVTATPIPENGDVVNYRINPDATYSDGAPVVCDDFLLGWVASNRADLFTSDLGLTERVDDLSCDAGAKDFRVEFERGMGSRYREIFSVGEVLPSHTIADRAGVGDVVGAVSSGDEAQLAALGEAWLSTFRVAETDPAEVPTYGPYRVESRGEDGSLRLALNPEWRGVRPGISEMVMYSGEGSGLEGPDYGRLAGDDQLYVADVPPETDLVSAGLESRPDGETTGAPASTTPAEDDEAIRGGATESAPDLADSSDGMGRFATARGSGTRVDGLTLADSGIFGTKENRQAFARCVDRSAVARAVGQESGITVDEAPFRIVSPGATEGESLREVAGRNNDRNPDETRDRLAGTTVRIAYFADVARHASMVDALVASCAEADVTVEPVPVTSENFGTLGEDYDVLLETRSSFGRNPQVRAQASTGTSTVRELRDAENLLADEAATIPLTAEPRSVAVDRGMDNVVDNPGETGMSWNMDRWASPDFPAPETENNDTTEDPDE